MTPTIALEFSGGRDSLACLYLLRPLWDRIYVLFVNTGAAYPETLTQLNYYRELLPFFVEIKSNQPEQIARCGYPGDVVPVNATQFGQATRNTGAQLIQSWSNCCSENMWRPLHETERRLGVTTIVRGTKNVDYRKTDLKSGTVIDGVQYILPLEGWSDENVLDYLDEIGVLLPASYVWSSTSLDCKDCTAFLSERQKELTNLKRVHPELWPTVNTRLCAIRDAVLADMRPLEKLTE